MSKRSIIICVAVVVLFIGAIASVVFDFKPKEVYEEPEPEPKPKKQKAESKPDVIPELGKADMKIEPDKPVDNGGK